MRAIYSAFIVAAVFAAAGCGSSTGSSDAGPPSVYDTPLTSDAKLINGTGHNPDVATDPNAPVSGGCLVRWVRADGNDIVCSDHPRYADVTDCDLTPYPEFHNLLVESCPTSNLVGSCALTANVLYYYAGYFIVSPDTAAADLSATCDSMNGSWSTSYQ